MTKDRKTLLGSAMAGALGIALLCSANVARAQDYSGETVMVHPGPYDTIQKHYLAGHVDNMVNPTAISISHPVSYSDLNLSQASDFAELRSRIRDTAQDVCDRLDTAIPPSFEGRDPYANPGEMNCECVRDAVRDAMAQVPERPLG